MRDGVTGNTAVFGAAFGSSNLPPAAYEGMIVYVDISWKSKAKCLGEDPNLFFPKVKASRNTVKIESNLDAAEANVARYCHGFDDGVTCPVLRECRDYAVRTGQHGVWGGTTEKERAKIRRKKRGAA